MKTLHIAVPDNLELSDQEASRVLAAALYEQGKLSLGQAADLAGLSKVAFAEILGDYGVSLMNYPVSEIRKDAAKI
jgi:predicted HTH domain antitoxin